MTRTPSVPIAEHRPPAPPPPVIPRSNSPNVFTLDRTVSWQNHGTREPRDRSEPESAVVTVGRTAVTVSGGTLPSPPSPTFLHPLDGTVRGNSSNGSLAAPMSNQSQNSQNPLRNPSAQIPGSSSNTPMHPTPPMVVSPRSSSSDSPMSPTPPQPDGRPFQDPCSCLLLGFLQVVQSIANDCVKDHPCLCFCLFLCSQCCCCLSCKRIIDQ